MKVSVKKLKQFKKGYVDCFIRHITKSDCRVNQRYTDSLDKLSNDFQPSFTGRILGNYERLQEFACVELALGGTTQSYADLLYHASFYMEAYVNLLLDYKKNKREGYNIRLSDKHQQVILDMLAIGHTKLAAGFAKSFAKITEQYWTKDRGFLDFQFAYRYGTLALVPGFKQCKDKYFEYTSKMKKEYPAIELWHNMW